MSNTRSRYARSAAVLAALLPTAAMGVLARSRRALPQLKGQLELDGLEGEARVDFDRWGIPHIKAASLQDALLVQGFVTAQDRMVQLELLRRIAGGTLAEVLGRKAVHLDAFMRDMGLKRTVFASERALAADTLRYLESYTAGVNSYLRSRRKSLPLEVLLLAAGRPQPWTVADSLSCLLFFTWTMDATWTADLMRGRLARLLGNKKAEVLLPASGPGSIPAVDYEGENPRERSEPPPECELDFLPFDEGNPPWMVKHMSVHAQGSNNWVLSGSRTHSGRPLLCSDPHVQHTIPTMFYLCHVNSEEPPCDFIGASLPGTPGVLMGRNRRIAWGATSLCPDVVDVYIETFEDCGGLRYRTEDGWKEARCREEEIKVLLGRSVKKQVLSTRHGPVIARRGNKAIALKWTGHETVNDSAGCLVRIAMADDWAGFNKGLEGYCGPALNMVYADTDNNIGYVAAGRIPIREGHDGSVPLRGEDPQYDWRGYIPPGEMPRVLNPERGWIATANNQVVGEGYPHVITSMWEPSCRQRRIAELLEARETHELEHMREIQGDVYTTHGSVLCREICKSSEVWTDASEQARKAAVKLSKWDCMADAESVAQTLYYFTWRVVSERLLRHRLGHRLYFEYTTSFFNVNHAVEAILTARDTDWLPPSAKDFDELLLQCLEEAVVRLQVRFGTLDMEEWRWGRLHTLRIPHLASGFKPLGRLLDLGPLPLGGDGETVNSAFSEGDPTIQVLARSSTGNSCDLPFLPAFHSDRVYAGPVFRMIVDLSAREGSLWCIDVGQCSNPLSGYYRNFFRLWSEVAYAPMAFSEEEIRESTRNTLNFVSKA